MQLTNSCLLSHGIVIAVALIASPFVALAIKNKWYTALQDSDLEMVRLATSWNKYTILFWLGILIVAATILNYLGMPVQFPPECQGIL